MDNLGERIAEQRSRLGLTQKDLGAKLNVSAQAVSKWENGQSEPDIDTVKKMCVLFGISMDEFLGMSGASDAAKTPSEPAPSSTLVLTAGPVPPAPPATSAPPATPLIINGYCEMCKKPVGPGEYHVVKHGKGGRHQNIYCNDCFLKREYSARVREYGEYRRKTNKSFIIGGIAGGIALVAGLLTMILGTSIPTGGDIAIGIALGLGYFAFITQMFWDGVVTEFLGVFFRSFGMPGIIFTLDIGGIVFFITVKLLLIALSIFLSVAWFVLGMTVIMPLFSLVVFPFALLKHTAEGRALKADADGAAAKLPSEK